MTGLAALCDFARGAPSQDMERMLEGLSPFGSQRDALFPDPVMALGSRHRMVTGLWHDHRLSLIADVRLDNPHELRDLLGLDVLQAPNDGHLILAAWSRWGKDCVPRFRGDFAFVLWDGETLFAVRDPFGVRPLLFAHQGQKLALANSGAPLLALPWCDRTLNEDKLARYLVLLHNDASHTFWRGVQRVPPAGLLSFSRSGLTVERYWQPQRPAPLRLARREDYHEAFREHLGNAIACRLPPTGKVGINLSGGLDSSAIACLTARTMEQPLIAYSAVPVSGRVPNKIAGRENDERIYIEAVQRHLRALDVRFVSIPDTALFPVMDHLTALTRRPVRNVINHLWLDQIHQASSREGVSILLTGKGGNLSISRTGRNRLANLAASGHFLELLTEVVAHARNTGSGVWQVSRQVLRSLLSPLVQSLRCGARPWTAWSAINPHFAMTHKVPELFRADLMERRQSDHDLRILTVGLGDNAEAMRCLEAARGIESRYPALDQRLVLFCMSLPDALWFHQGQDRALPREALQGILPESVRLRTSRGVQGADWPACFKYALPQLKQELSELEQHDTARRVLDLPRLRDLLEHIPGNWYTAEATGQYRMMFLRALFIGRFIRWYEAGALTDRNGQLNLKGHGLT